MLNHFQQVNHKAYSLVLSPTVVALAARANSLLVTYLIEGGVCSHQPTARASLLPRTSSARLGPV
jgi:hypothetical protein